MTIDDNYSSINLGENSTADSANDKMMNDKQPSQEPTNQNKRLLKSEKVFSRLPG